MNSRVHIQNIETDRDLEPVDLINLNDDALDPYSCDNSEDRFKNYFSHPASPYKHTSFPVIVLSSKMKILFANDACEELFSGFFDLSGAYFFDVFGATFCMSEMKNIHDAITGRGSHYFWKGEVQVKSRSLISVLVKTYIFPAHTNELRPTEFVVMFDNVTEENKRQTRSTFISLLEASKLKDNDTGNHVLRVNQYSKCLSQALYKSGNSQYNRIDADFIDNIGFLASMHDVGKIGTPDDILNKKGPLLDWERTLMREHTKNGAFILSSYPNPMAKEVALSHHERWDGSGYPYQLSGDMIPISARIVAIADVYDALRMRRSYKPPFTHKVASQKIIEGKGRQFDPFMTDIFTSIHHTFEKIFESNIEVPHKKSALPL
ncbi:MAG: HD domain-containing protein [Treponema sp.]|jgi:putative two-component system response regulator|nr:HD domain-containing protein [Treponema sp.]